MARARSPNRDKAFEMWKNSGGTFLLKDIAAVLGIKDSQVRKWKNQDKWDEQLKGNVTKTKRNVTISKKAKPVIESDELTDKQKLFCLYYIKYFNATKAYQKAYGVDRNTAESIAYRLMGNDGVRSEIERLKQERFNGVLLDAQAVLQKYIDIAFADITDFVDFGQREMPELDHNGEPMIDENGEEITYSYSFVNLKNNDEVDGTLITEVKKGKDGVSVKLADKMKALEFLSKYTDLLSENDKKRLQEEKLRMEISKLQNNDETSQESQVAKMLRKLAGDE